MKWNMKEMQNKGKNMEKTILRLLEISRELDEANLGEFDFGNLQEALTEFEQKAPEILQLEKDSRILGNHIMMRIMGKLRALKAAGHGKVSSVWENQVLNSPGITSQKLVELDNQLREEMNNLLSTKANFMKVASVGEGKVQNEEYKIGG